MRGELRPVPDAVQDGVRRELACAGPHPAGGQRVELQHPVQRLLVGLVAVVDAVDAGLDAALARWNATLPKLAEFILPAGTRSAALAHVARTVARRAERAVVALGAAETVRPEARQYLNRLSDLLFVLARVLNRANLDGLGGDDIYWKSERLQRGTAAD